MKRTIAVISATRVSLAPVEETAAALFPDVELFHLMDEGMSYLAKKEGGISGANLRRMASLVGKAEELGVDGILLSCTIFSPHIDLISAMADVPVVAADVAMFETAARAYHRLGVVVTFGPTVKSVSAVLDRCRNNGMSFEAEIRVAEGAFDACARGDDEEHNRLVAACARSMAPHSDVIVLSQMSQMRAVPLLKDLSVPVLTSPPVSMEFLMKKIEERAK
ncbi:aspartate/glutamate racemase family protein [Papillibacter cinnamivorans]|uniref:Arylsulfatase n=1 Tax=Papillibacter cinnamivorans DSM 12816 TaxID=1122930 RepID=A0A1W1YEI9_9FIRM|nr:aspartate/glutamate racemase family protein [Papillibacter cinnamivorans]SMC34188.1 hypothetical protein SAMN02745168_0355 [Papillibacter cinnamivorans DSM 12816]